MSKKSIAFTFLKNYLAWAEAGAPLKADDNPFMFRRQFGLCYNCYSVYGIKVLRQLHKLLEKEFPCNPRTPFNGHKLYVFETQDRDHHKNPLRLEFCRKMIAELEGKNQK